MAKRNTPFVSDVIFPPALPGWAKLTADHHSADRSFLAGAGLVSLSYLVRSGPAYTGALGQRLALKAAKATSVTIGRTEDEDAIRDQWWLRPRGEALSPAAAVLDVWLSFLRSSGPSATFLQEASAGFGTPLVTPPVDTAAMVLQAAKAVANPISASAHASAVFFEREPGCEALAHAVADSVLALRLGWPAPLPLLSWSIAAPLLRSGGQRRRALPRDGDWAAVVFGAYALSCMGALQMAQGIAVRSQKLLAFAPELRSKGAGNVVNGLLSHACLAGSTSIVGMSDRAMRRILDRLTSAGVVRELTGRSSFRLYGL